MKIYSKVVTFALAALMLPFAAAAITAGSDESAAVALAAPMVASRLE